METVLPIVHLNGTSREELVELRRSFLSALRKARNALSEMSPNGRDYYPEAGRMEKAQEQHRRRDKAFDDLAREIQGEIKNLLDE